MKICFDCQSQIHKNDKWKIDGSRIRHVNCRNPRLIEARLPLWQDKDPLVESASQQRSSKGSSTQQ